MNGNVTVCINNLYKGRWFLSPGTVIATSQPITLMFFGDTEKRVVHLVSFDVLRVLLMSVISISIVRNQAGFTSWQTDGEREDLKVAHLQQKTLKLLTSY